MYPWLSCVDLTPPSGPDEIVSVLEHLGLALHRVVWEGQAPGVNQQDGEELALPTGRHLLFIHCVRQREEEEDSREDGSRAATQAHAGTRELLCPARIQRTWVRSRLRCECRERARRKRSAHRLRMTAPMLG